VKKILFLPFLLVYSFLISQTFSTSLIEPISNDNGWKIVETEDGFLTVSVSSINNSFSGSLAFFKTDFDGNFQWNKFHDSLTIGSVDLVVEGDTIICNCFNKLDTLDHTRLMGFDLEGNILFEKKIGADLDGEAALRIAKTDDNYALMHRIYIDGVRHGWLQFLDKDFNIETEAFFAANDSVGTLSGSDLIPTFDNKFIGASTSYQGIDEGFFPTISKFNEMGEIEWSTQFNIGSNIGILEVIELSNNNLAVSWYTNTIVSELPSYPVHPPAIYGLDSNGNLEWSYEFEVSEEINESIQLLRLVPLANTDFLGLGYLKQNFSSQENLDGCGWIFRMSAEGELLWQKRFCLEEEVATGNFFYNGLELPNGDLLISGSITNFKETGNGFDPNVWLLKLESNGCLEPGCEEIQIITETEEVLIDTAPTFSLFPNPVRNTLNIQYKGEQALQQVTTFILYNSLGQVVYEEKLHPFLPKEIISINLTSLPSTWYTYQLHFPKGGAQTGKILKQ
jgi:hypothetical protein